MATQPMLRVIVQFAAVVITVLIPAWIGWHRPTCLADEPASPTVDAAVGTDDPRFVSVAPLIRQAIADGRTPGAVVVFATSESVLYAQAFGDRRIEPSRQPMKIDTLFDLASISKPIGTATSVMVLVDQERVNVDDHVVDYLPEFASHGKEKITIEQLLLHTSGLIPDNALSDYRDGAEMAWQRICELKLRSDPGVSFAYSDVGFMVLGKLVQTVSGKRLDRFAKDHVFDPLGMTQTAYHPTPKLRDRAAATESRGGKMLQGVVHDPRAAVMEGVAGHAGVFSTAADLTRFGQAMLRQGRYQSDGIEKQLFGKATFDAMVRPRTIRRGTRTYGWDHQSPYSGNRGQSLSPSAFGHGGFTGTVMWIDPAKDLIFVFLSTRLHPDGKGSVNSVAGEIVTNVGTSW